MKSIVSFIGCVSIWLAVQAGAMAEIPSMIYYQGRLLNDTSLVNRTVGLALHLYNAPFGGRLLCTDSSQVAVVDGLYSTAIGDDTPPGALAAALTNDAVYIEVEVNGTTLAPRERIGSVAYAVMAARLPDGAVTGAMLADNAVSSAKIAPGAVGSADLAAGAVLGFHLATGAVSAVNIATGSVGYAQLARKYQSGTIVAATFQANDGGFQAYLDAPAAFIPPFGGLPIITLGLASTNVTYAAQGQPCMAAVAPTGFTARVPAPTPMEATIDATNASGYCKLAMVAGHPAAAYTLKNGDLRYCRANDSLGAFWGTPVVLDTNTIWQLSNLIIINGNPAISYYDSDHMDLMFIRAADAQGTSWHPAVAVYTNGATGKYPSMQVVNSYPAISFKDETLNALLYIRSTNINGGSGWLAPSAVYTNLDPITSSLTTIDGHPALAFNTFGAGGLFYARSDDPAGTTWSNVVELLTNENAGASVDFQSINGYPMLAFIDSDIISYTHLYCMRNTNTAGAGEWEAPVLLATNLDISCYFSMASIKGRPTIVYHDIDDTLCYLRANDGGGATWPSATTLSQAVDNWAMLSLQSVMGEPAVIFQNADSETMGYLRNLSFPLDSRVNWIAVEP